jgi:hypothetical protein
MIKLARDRLRNTFALFDYLGCCALSLRTGNLSTTKELENGEKELSDGKRHVGASDPGRGFSRRFSDFR